MPLDLNKTQYFSCGENVGQRDKRYEMCNLYYKNKPFVLHIIPFLSKPSIYRCGKMLGQWDRTERIYGQYEEFMSKYRLFFMFQRLSN